MPIVIHVLKRSLLSKDLDKVVVCTDNNKIISEVKKNKGLYFRSKKKHQNGTERIAEFPVNKKIKFIILLCKNDVNGSNLNYDGLKINEK